MYRWIVFLHVLSAFGFFLAHGSSAATAFRLKEDRALERIRALMLANVSTIPAMMLALLVVIVTGVVLGFMGGWWRSGWIWTSLALLVLVFVWMMWYTGRYYAPIRRAAGLPHRDGNDIKPAVEPLNEDEIARLVDATNPLVPLGIGLGVWVVIVYLMMFKPF